MPAESLLWAFCCFGIVDYGFYRKAIRATAASTTIARNTASTVKPSAWTFIKTDATL